MKYNGTAQRSLRVDQYDGGYLITPLTLGCGDPAIKESFEDMIGFIANRFFILEVGERIVLSATREPKETALKGKDE